MLFQNYALTMLTVLALSGGQMLFKLAARDLTGTQPLMHQIIGNQYLWVAPAVYGLATAFRAGLLGALVIVADVWISVGLG